MILPEVYLRVVSCFQIVPPNAAHIFGNDSTNLARFHISYESFSSGTFKVSAAITIICVVAAVGEAMLLGIVFQIGFLIGDGITLSKLFVVPGQSFIQRCNVHSHVLLRLVF